MRAFSKWRRGKPLFYDVSKKGINRLEKLLAPDMTSKIFSIYYPDIRPGSTDYTVVASMNANYADWFRFR